MTMTDIALAVLRAARRVNNSVAWRSVSRWQAFLDADHLFCPDNQTDEFRLTPEDIEHAASVRTEVLDALCASIKDQIVSTGALGSWRERHKAIVDAACSLQSEGNDVLSPGTVIARTRMLFGLMVSPRSVRRALCQAGFRVVRESRSRYVFYPPERKGYEGYV